MNRAARDVFALLVVIAFCWAVIALAGCEPLPLIGEPV